MVLFPMRCESYQWRALVTHFRRREDVVGLSSPSVGSRLLTEGSFSMWSETFRKYSSLLVDRH